MGSRPSTACHASHEIWLWKEEVEGEKGGAEGLGGRRVLMHAVIGVLVKSTSDLVHDT